MPKKLLSNPKLSLLNEFKAKGEPAKAAKIRTKKKFHQSVATIATVLHKNSLPFAVFLLSFSRNFLT